MATRSTSRDNAASDTDTASGQNAVAEATRQQMASTASAASAMLRTLESFQQTQQHLIQRAALLQEQTAERLRNASTPVEVLSIQSTMMMSGFTDLAQYAQELMLASLKAQEAMRPAEPQATTAMPMVGTAAPLFQAWQAVFTAPMNGAAGVRHH